MRDYFKDLGLTPDASLDDIKRAHKRLAKQFHPDLNSEHLEKFQEIQEAFESLSSTTKITRVRNALEFREIAKRRTTDVQPQEKCPKCENPYETLTTKARVCENCSGKGFRMIERGANHRWKKTCDRCQGSGREPARVCKHCSADR